jgi:hypothetical protein
MCCPTKRLEPRHWLSFQGARATSGVLYEIFARSTPWPGLANVNVVLRVAKGERMELPDSVPAAVRKTVRQCWAHEPNERPKMQAVVDRLLCTQ